MSRLTDGHLLAIEQIKKIAKHQNGSLEIIAIPAEQDENGFLPIYVSISCEGIKVIPEGLQLKQRERIVIYIPASFPFYAPVASFLSAEHALSPHVQWGRHICLYFSEDMEWNPNGGMFRFIERLGKWLMRAGVDQLDETGEPLHPPNTFAGIRSEYSICSNIDLPPSTADHWKGVAVLTKLNNCTYEIKKWVPRIPADRGDYGAVLVLNEKVPYEYPATVWGLFTLLKNKGYDFIEILEFLKEIVSKKRNKLPFFFFICSPMMGIKGEVSLKHHIACWEIDNRAVRSIRALKLTDICKSKRAKVKRKGAAADFAKWAVEAKTKWCTVYENRPEVTVRRDMDTKLSIFKGKSVYLLGCGALGAHVGIMLARAAVKSLVLHDNKNVNPGILVRQPFTIDQTNTLKAEALRLHIENISKEISIKTVTSDISDALLSSDTTAFDGMDVILDCTASNRVHFLMEYFFAKKKERPLIISMSVDRDLENGMLVCLNNTYSCNLFGAYHKTLTDACANHETSQIAAKFLSKPVDLFQPVPGCSEPTFRGSSSDAMLFSSHMLNLSSRYMGESSKEMVSYIISHKGDSSSVCKTKFLPDFTLHDAVSGYSVHITQRGVCRIKEQIRTCNKNNETGGILFGMANDVLKTIWIDEITGAPADSISEPTKFVCGTEGVKELSEKIQKTYKKQINAIGTWHTHPKSVPFPSVTDLNGVAKILAQKDTNRERTLLLIIQPISMGSFNIGAYLFKKSENKNGQVTIKWQMESDIKKLVGE